MSQNGKLQTNGLGGSSRVALTPDEASRRWERKCDPKLGCRTACCHFEGSPCEHLEIENVAWSIGTCRIYTKRFGEHFTVDGKLFKCVPMMERLKHVAAPEHCGYADVKTIDGVPVVTGKA